MIVYLYPRVCEEFNFIVCSPGFSLDRRVVVTGVNIRDRGEVPVSPAPVKVKKKACLSMGDTLFYVPPKSLFRNFAT